MPDASWVSSLIGRPYARLAKGPDAFDCWGLCQYVWRVRLGIDVPDVLIDIKDPAALREAFASFAAGAISAVVLPRPVDLCGVYMTRGSRHPDHIGLWLENDGGGVLHSMERLGVTFTKRASLRVLGLQISSFLWFKDR